MICKILKWRSELLRGVWAKRANINGKWLKMLSKTQSELKVRITLRPLIRIVRMSAFWTIEESDRWLICAKSITCASVLQYWLLNDRFAFVIFTCISVCISRPATAMQYIRGHSIRVVFFLKIRIKRKNTWICNTQTIFIFIFNQFCH